MCVTEKDLSELHDILGLLAESVETEPSMHLSYASVRGR